MADFLRSLSRSMDQDAAESIRLRRWHARAKEVRAGGDANEDSWRITRAIKNIWNRASEEDRSCPDDNVPTKAFRRDSVTASDPESQPFDRISFRAGDCKVRPLTFSSGSRSLPGTYPTEDAVEVLDSSFCEKDCNETAGPTYDVVSSELDRGMIVSSFAKKFVTSSSAGVSAIEISNGSRVPLDTTANETASQTELIFDRQRELIDDIERFQFTTLVSTATINGTRDLRTLVAMTSNNLLNSAWDLHRLCMGWKEVFLESPNLLVLEMAEPWNQLDKEHVARACRHVQRALETYREWSENMRYARAVAMTRNLMSGEWWADFDEKLSEADVLELDDVTTQVELVAKGCCVIESSTALQSAASPEEAATIVTTPSSQLPLRKLQPSSLTQTLEADHSPAAIVVNDNRPSLQAQKGHAPRKLAVSRTPLPIPSSTPEGALRHERGPEQVVQSVPSFARSTNSSLQGRQMPIVPSKLPERANLPVHLQPLAIAIQNVRSKPLQTKVRPRNNSEAVSNSQSLRTPARPHGLSRATSRPSLSHAQSKDAKHLTAASPGEGTSEHTIACPEPPQKLGVTLPRSFKSRTEWGSGAHTYDSTRTPSKAADTHTSKML